MEIEQVAELARTVAGLPKGHQDFFNGLLADERTKAAMADRIARLRKLSDEDAVQLAIKRASDVWDVVGLPDRLLTALREVGFVRTGGITLEQAYRAGFSTSAEGWNYERHGEEAFARQAFKDEMANELCRLKPEVSQ